MQYAKYTKYCMFNPCDKIDLLTPFIIGLIFTAFFSNKFSFSNKQTFV